MLASVLVLLYKCANTTKDINKAVNRNVDRFPNEIIEYDTQIKTLKETLDKFEEKKKVTETQFDGKIFDVYSKIYKIFSEVKKKLVIIDNYADIGILDVLKD